MRRLAVSIAVAGVVVACGGKTKSSWGPDGKHERRPDASVQRIPALTLAQAQAKLAEALAGDDPFGVVVYGNRALAGGGEVEVDLAAYVDRLDRDLLEASWGELELAHPPAAEVALRLALMARHGGQDDAALEWAARVKGPLAQRAGEVAAEIRARRAVELKTVAVLLPLSGPYERVGREIETAVELAGRRDGEAKLVFVDTAGTEEGAITAVEAAVYTHHALAILGPVGQRESRAAAGRAVELGIPIALLAPGAGGGAVDAGVFRLWPSGSSVAAEAAKAAVERGYDSLAVLSPRDEYGWAQRRAFEQAAVAAGARVVALGEYDPTATDLEPDIKAFLGLDPAKNARLRKHLRKHPKHGWKTFSPDVEFDLLFIPDQYQRAALVVAYLPFFNVELRTNAMVDSVDLRRKHGGRLPSLVQLMGSPGWHHPGLFPRGGEAVEGALVVDVCAGGDGEEFATEGAALFHEAFQRRVRRAPTPTASQAYDAALLVLSARRRAADRPGFIEKLVGARLEDGACGAARVGSNGELVRSVVILRVDGGEFMVEMD